MSSIDLILLGLVHDQPRSAYEMQKHVEYRNLGKWVRISTPSVYKKVLRLEQQGYLARHVEKAGRMPEKAVYSITPKGLKRFEELMREGASSAVEVLFDFNAVVANLNKLPQGEALQLIDTLRGGILESLKYMEGVRPEREHIPLTGRAVLDQQILVLKALCGWADGFRAQFAREGSAKTLELEDKP
jgi:DNA-binding PadR family transcriptional regulator